MRRSFTSLRPRRTSVGPRVEGLESRQLLTGSATTSAAGSLAPADTAPTPSPLTGVGVAILARTGSPIAHGTVATFRDTDSVGAEGAVIFDVNGTATIDYGDGTLPQVGDTHTTIAPDGIATIAVVPFQEHVYTQAGVYTVHVTYKFSGDGVNGPDTSVTTSTATVSDNANVPNGSLQGTGVSIIARTGDPMVSTVLARFPAPIGTFNSPTIDYGDGTPVEDGMLTFADSGTGNIYVASGQGHVYAHAGTYTILVNFIANGEPGTVTSTATVSDAANVPDGAVHGTGVDFLARTNTPMAPTPLAHFTAPSAGSFGETTIDYGDGTPKESLYISSDSATSNDYTVNDGGHIYTQAGTYTVHVTFSLDGQVVTATSTATVADNADVPDGSIRGTGTSFIAKTGDPIISTPLAHFTAPLANLLAGATVDYGDGTPVETLLLNVDPGTSHSFTVYGAGHIYAHAGTYTVHVTMSSNMLIGSATSTATVSDDADVPDGSLHGTGTSFLTTTGSLVSGIPLAHLTSPLAGWFGSAQIDYGDGTPLQYLILSADSPNGNTYTVKSDAGHIYTKPGIYTVHITATMSNLVGEVTSTATVTGDPVTIPNGQNFPVGVYDPNGSVFLTSYPLISYPFTPIGGIGQLSSVTSVSGPALPTSGAGAPQGGSSGPVALAPASNVPKWLAAFEAKVEVGGHSLWTSYPAHPNGLLASHLKTRRTTHHPALSTKHHATPKVHPSNRSPKLPV